VFKVGPAHRDKAEIKCMGSVGGKIPTEPKVYFSLTLGILNKIILMFMSIYFIQSLHGRWNQTIKVDVAFKTFSRSNYSILWKDSLSIHIV
jgi:hypothetical protein